MFGKILSYLNPIDSSYINFVLTIFNKGHDYFQDYENILEYMPIKIVFQFFNKNF